MFVLYKNVNKTVYIDVNSRWSERPVSETLKKNNNNKWFFLL